jgi:hypothetical protein
MILGSEDENVNLSSQTGHPSAADLKVIHNLNRLDKYIIRSADYDEYVELLWDFQHGCLERFHVWLAINGLEGQQDKFIMFTESYLSFIYGHEHEEPVTLKSVSDKYFLEFFMGHLLRETSVKLLEYILSPTAVRLFYKFLHDKGYQLKDPYRMIRFINKLEPYFVNIIRGELSPPIVQLKKSCG